MKTRTITGLLTLTIAAIASAVMTRADDAQLAQPATLKKRAPQFRGVTEWINSKPLSLKDLRGKVVIVHFWTFG